MNDTTKTTAIQTPEVEPLEELQDIVHVTQSVTNETKNVTIEPEAKKTKRVKPATAMVRFESREAEPTMFEVAGYRPTRNFSNNRLEWEIPSEDVARFEAHHFCQMARVVRMREE